MVRVTRKNGWKYESHRVEGNDTWEFISVGVYSDAEEVADLVRQQGKTCELGFSSFVGWFVRIRIENN